MSKQRAAPSSPYQDISGFFSNQVPNHPINRKLLAKTSPLSKYIESEHQQAGLFSLSPTDTSLDNTFNPQKKRRKKCGACTPCLRKENCRTCVNCLNRKTGKQICKLRKCEELKRRRDTWETVHEVTSLDGPRGGDQMEIGSHDCLQEGVLSLDLSNRVNCYPNDDEAATETEQKRAAGVPPRQCWVPTHGKEQQQPLLKHNSGANPSEPVHHVDMEDAHNLVTFSATAGTLPPSSISSCIQVQPDTMQLYEKFTREMGAGRARVGHSAVAPDTSHQPAEDMKTLQTALNHAKHGHKPPNCDCDGPDCPDYLEWLEKKIKLATSENQDTSKTTDCPHLEPNIQQSHLQNQPYLLVNGGHHHLTSSYPQQQQRTKASHAGQVPCSKLPPIPCSPQVLSIAKERNVSLQTAIAIEALTQLSGTGTQGPGPPSQALLNNNLHQQTQNLSSPLPNCTNMIPSTAVTCPLSRSQSVPPGLLTDQQAAVSCEHHRPHSQGQPPHASTSPFPGRGNPQNFGRSPQRWLQGTCGGSEEHLSHYAGAPHSRSDPVSELKQLLGATSGKLINASFKLPSTQQHSENGGVQAQGQPSLPRIKQEADLSDHSFTMGHYNMDNGQLQARHYPGTSTSPGQAAIRNSTQAALQQHLHYKRNLFSNHSPGFGAPGPVAYQNVKKWWPQMEANGFNHLSIKQELKEPKRKKNSQGSPVIKVMSGIFPGPLLPKPKQIIIKKSKQKASVPTFLPKSQITVEKTSVHMTGRANTLNNLQPGSLPLLPSHSNSTQATVAGLPAPAQSQVSISNLSMAPSSTTSALSSNNPTLIGFVPPPMAHAHHAKSEEVGNLFNSNASTASALTSTLLPNTSHLPGLININPKYEELILQFEAEFGDSAADIPSIEAMSETATASQIMNQSLTGAQDLTLSSTTQNQLSFSHISESSSTPHTNKKEMDDKKDESETQSEVTSNEASTVTPMLEQQEPQSTISQHQESPLDEHPQHSQIQETFNIPCSPMPKRMKIETTGDITVLSTNCYSEEDTPTKDGLPRSPSLKGFLESPLNYLDTPTRSLLDTPSKDLQAEFPTCTCVEQVLEKDEGPYYNHLGSGPTVASIRDLMETRYGEKGDAIRIEKVVYTGREGKSSRGCPIAKWVIRRGSEKEKLLCLVRHRAGHHCGNAVIIILIMAWEGVPRSMADTLYREISDTLTKFGNPTSRRCGLNDDRTCACQGKDPDTCGASFSFGCSWSMYFNGCKYARSKTPRKFRLQGERPEEEDKLRDQFQNLATEVAPLYRKLAPQAYSNQCQSETKASDCRLGLKAGRPFAGVTACLDFCAHAHKDQHNLYNGCTVVCTLTKEDNRMVGEIPQDEQLHVLPLYKVSTTDEFGSEEGQRLKMKTGAIQVLQAFRREVRRLPEPAKSCRQRRLDAKKAASEKKKSKLQQQAAETPEKKTVVKAEVCFSESPQHPGNKAITKQEVKPNIKKEPFNGSMDAYSLQAADAIKTMCPHPAYYARGGLPTTGQPSAGDPVNGYNQNLPASHYGFYNYPSNALFAPKMRTYEGRSSSLSKAGRMAFQLDNKPDIHSFKARLAHSYPGHPAQPTQNNSQSSDYNQSRPSSVPSEASNIGTPVIKQEPMDMPVCEDTGLSQPGATQPTNWPGNRSNGSLVPTNWDHQNPKQHPEDSFSNAEKQMLHQHLQQQPSPYPQPWTSFPASNTLMESTAASPVPHVPPSSSPHLGTLRNIHQGSPRPSTPRPSTPHPGTPQPGITHPFLIPHPGNSHSPSHIPQPATPRQWASPAPSPEPKSWATGHGAYSPGLKHSNPAGAYPDKMWSKTGESRCSTPLGVQEKAWKSCGGSVAGSTPSPAPEGRLFPDALQQSDQPCWDPSRAESDAESTKGQEEDDDEVWSDSEHNFLDPNIGGVAVAPAHGSILIECARRELHATTPLKKPDRSHPSRISLVFYQHKNLQQPIHGLALWEAKMKMLEERALQRQQEAALLGLSQEEIKALSKKRKWGATAAGATSGAGQSKDKREGPVTRLAPTFHTTSMVNVSPYAFTQLTGPYSHFV